MLESKAFSLKSVHRSARTHGPRYRPVRSAGGLHPRRRQFARKVVVRRRLHPFRAFARAVSSRSARISALAKLSAC